MARLYRPTIIRYVDKSGKRCTKNTPGAKRVATKSKTWRGEFRDPDGILRSETLCTNKDAARTMLADRIRAVQSGDPFHKHRRRPLTEHVSDFIETLKGAGRSHGHYSLLESRCRSIISGCRFRFISDISASTVQSYLADEKRNGMAQQTVNHYLRAIKQFSRWLVRDRRTGDDRLQYLSGGNVKAEGIRRERREFNDDEIRRILQATIDGPSRLGLSAIQRFMLYATALGTGFRALEISSLTVGAFDLNATPSTVTLLAADEKRRRGAVQPLPADLVSLLQPWLKGRRPDELLWPGRWAEQKRAGRGLQLDMKAAREAWLREAETDAVREDWENSDFLKWEDSQGRFADFHALRHTYLSRLGRSGASPKVMQMLARHSTVELTLGRYTHAGLFDLSAAIDRLPALPVAPTPVSSMPLRQTGTAAIDSRPTVVAGMVAGFSGNH